MYYWRDLFILYNVNSAFFFLIRETVTGFLCKIALNATKTNITYTCIHIVKIRPRMCMVICRIGLVNADLTPLMGLPLSYGRFTFIPVQSVPSIVT